MKKLKSGYTTGSCVVAGTMGALNYFFKDTILENIKIDLLDENSLVRSSDGGWGGGGKDAGSGSPMG